MVLHSTTTKSPKPNHIHCAKLTHTKITYSIHIQNYRLKIDQAPQYERVAKRLRTFLKEKKGHITIDPPHLKKQLVQIECFLQIVKSLMGWLHGLQNETESSDSWLLFLYLSVVEKLRIWGFETFIHHSIRDGVSDASWLITL